MIEGLVPEDQPYLVSPRMTDALAGKGAGAPAQPFSVF
jgi:hypothetical protein